MFTEGVYYRLGSKTLVFSLLRFIPLVVIGILALIFLSYAPQGVARILGTENSSSILPLIVTITEYITLYGSIAFTALCTLLIGSTCVEHATHEFMLDRYALRIRSGFLSRHEITIPYDQIQNVNMNESILGRMFGISELIVLTAGNEDDGEESSGTFSSIDRTLAVSLQDELLKRSSVQEVRQAESVHRHE
jgi:uncharacterized membrane protein YdbT with pleckstrin-like domain